MTLSFECTCGQTAWELPGADASAGTRTICYCRDCRAFARYLGVDDRMEPGGGVDLFITRPGRIHVTRGLENMALMKLSPNGRERWYTSCCKSPVTSHLAGWAPMAGLLALPAVDRDALGEVRMIYGAKDAIPGQGAPEANRGVAALMLRILFGWALPGFVLRRLRDTPFYKDGRPIAEATILTKDQRAAITD